MTWDPTALEAYSAWTTVIEAIDQDEWTVKGRLIEKDGFEVWNDEDGFELVAKHPETSEDVILVEKKNLDIASPRYAAAFIWTLHNAEEIAKESDELTMDETLK